MTMKPVSYTHLDVYKRQILTIPIGIRMNFARGLSVMADGFTPVSYTHLIFSQSTLLIAGVQIRIILFPRADLLREVT